ncbi:MAG: zinc-ribbon domain-containing protein [Anaerolineales bacterium]|nr:zinc-ribbon domain-containing protein [Anaerolineales bacterium]
MSRLKELPSIWNNIKEMDLRPLQVEALRGVKIAIAGRAGSGKRLLARQMRRDPRRPDEETLTPMLLLDLDAAEEPLRRLSGADLVILLVNPQAAEATLERGLQQALSDAGRRVLVFIPLPGEVEAPQAGGRGALDQWGEWGKGRLLAGPLGDSEFLGREFVPAALELLPDLHLTLGRHFPLFRQAICRRLINDACFTNAAYAFSTGMAAIVPVLDIPLNVADMVVLSKNQAFLVYKLGLALGLSTRWQNYVTEFGGVLGGGFFWRQVARQLVGLIPAWGIAPKVAVAYAGTYVVGNVVYQWYLTGKHLTRQQMRQLYLQAFQRGKEMAAGLAQRLPRAGRKAERKALPAPKTRRGTCPHCGKKNARDAQFCQYCGKSLTAEEE